MWWLQGQANGTQLHGANNVCDLLQQQSPSCCCVPSPGHPLRCEGTNPFPCVNFVFEVQLEPKIFVRLRGFLLMESRGSLACERLGSQYNTTALLDTFILDPKCWYCSEQNKKFHYVPILITVTSVTTVDQQLKLLNCLHILNFCISKIWKNVPPWNTMMFNTIVRRIGPRAFYFTQEFWQFAGMTIDEETPHQ